MTAKTAAEMGFTPGKIGVIVGLSVLLIAALVYQLAGSTPQAPTMRKRQPSQASASSPGAAAGGVAAGQVGAAHGTAKWPDLPVDQVARFDPFAFPETLTLNRLRPGKSHSSLQPFNSPNGQSASTDLSAYPGGESPTSGDEASGDSRQLESKRRLEEQRAVAAELQRRGVGMILRTSSGSVAHIGDLELRVGDVLNGLRVSEIGPDGIRLIAEPADASDSASHP